MKAAWYEKAGSAADVIRVGEIPDPVPGPGAVRVRIAVSASNPHDVKKRRTGRELPQYERVIPNCDGSGEIDRVGDGVSPSLIGQRVWLFAAQIGQSAGTGAEYCVVPAWKAVPLPTSTSFEHGACLGIPAITAYHAVFSNGPVAGKTLLISGGQGRVGGYALQLAKLAGATVISSTRRSENENVLRELGAEHVVNYSDGDPVSQIKAIGRPIDGFISGALGRDFNLAVKTLSPLGHLAAYGFDDEPAPTIPCLRLSAKNLTVRYIGIFSLPQEHHVSAFAKINQLLASDSLIHRIGLSVSINDLAEAHATIENSRVSGAVLSHV